MNQKIKVGLVGFGYSARVFHTPFLKNNPNYEVITVFARSSPKMYEYFPNVQIVHSIEDLLNTNIDLVFITTPNQTHYEFTKKALLANKNVVVEKPICNTVEEALELKQLAEEKGLLLTVYQNRRWDSSILSAKKILNQRDLLGKLLDCEIRFERYSPEKNKKSWKETGELGTGLVYDLGVHLIDQALHLFGLPEALFADIRYQREGAISDDNFWINLYYPNHFTVRLGASKHAKLPNRFFALHGQKGSYIQEQEDQQEALLNYWDSGIFLSPDGRTEKRTSMGFGIWFAPSADGFLENECGKIPFAVAGNYSAFYENLAESLAKKALPAVKMSEVVQVLSIIEQVFVSAKTGQKITVKGL